MANIYCVDLGTSMIKIAHNKTPELVKERNVLAIINRNQLYCYGNKAYEMFEKAPASLEISFPVSNGVISDFNNIQTMIFEMMEKEIRARLRGAEFFVSVPSDITEVEKKAFFDLFAKSKAKPKRVLLCEKPIADAVGMNLDPLGPNGILVVDMGADTTEISLISVGDLVMSELHQFGGNRIDQSIRSYLKRNYNLAIGKRTAEYLKEKLASAIPGKRGKEIIVGIDVVSGLPVQMELSAQIIYDAIKNDLESIADTIRIFLEKMPPELAKDILKTGIYVTGGCSSIPNMQYLLQTVTTLPVNMAANPDTTAVNGLSTIATDEKFKDLVYTMRTKFFR